MTETTKPTPEQMITLGILAKRERGHVVMTNKAAASYAWAARNGWAVLSRDGPIHRLHLTPAGRAALKEANDV